MAGRLALPRQGGGDYKVNGEPAKSISNRLEHLDIGIWIDSLHINFRPLKIFL